MPFVADSPDTAVAEPVRGKFVPDAPVGRFAPDLMPEDIMKQKAPLIMSGQGTAEDEAAYKNAYRDYYAKNDVGTRTANFLSSLHPSEWVGVIGQMGRNLQDWHQEINSPDSATLAKPLDAMQGSEAAQTLRSIPRIAEGAWSGLKQTGHLGLNLVAAGFEQLLAAAGEAKHDPKLIDTAADIALQRLKSQRAAAIDTENPYTNPAERAQFAGGQFIGNMLVPVPGINRARSAVAAGGDILEAGANKAAGAAMRTAGPATTAAGTAMALGGAASNPAAAASAAATTLASKVIGDSGGLLGTPYKILTEGNAMRRGFFQAADQVGSEVMATPMGKSIIDQLAERGNALQDAARAKKIGTGLDVTNLRAQLKDAAEQSMPQGKLKAALAKAESADRAVEIQQNILQRGLDVAQWLKANGMAKIPSKTADAISGAISGSLLGGSLQAMQGQPGDSNAQGAAMGASFGTLLGLLGTAAIRSSESQLRQTANESATNVMPPYRRPPSAAVDLEVMGNEVPVIENRQRNLPSSGQVLLLGNGEAVDANAFAKELAQVTSEYVDNQRQIAAPLTKETFNLRTEKAVGSEKYDFPTPSDQIWQNLAAKSNAINAPEGVKSSWIDRVSYDPESQIGLIRVAPGKAGKGGARAYGIVGITPEKWQAFQIGLIPTEGASTEAAKYSMGQYFNKYIKNYENTVRIYDDLWGQENKPPPHTILDPSAPEGVKKFVTPETGLPSFKEFLKSRKP